MTTVKANTHRNRVVQWRLAAYSPLRMAGAGIFSLFEYVYAPWVMEPL